MKSIFIGKNTQFGLKEFQQAVLHNNPIEISPHTMDDLQGTRTFVDHILKNNISVYGLTTGFADLRSQTIDASQASKLSENLIQSHDAAIGPSMDPEIVLGAMCVRASSLSKGNSGIRPETLVTLVQMINSRIIPLIPMTGSLGASGDLATLSRLGRAMMGEDVPVYFNGKTVSAKEALKQASIPPFVPHAKEGLAITNGTSFMISMLSLAYLEEIKLLETLFALTNLFLSSTNAVNAAYFQCMQEVRKQRGQKFISKILFDPMIDSPFIDTLGVQNDYCIRCLPQIYGPKIETIFAQKSRIEAELDAVTDNPLLFKQSEISPDVNKNRLFDFNGERWAILSGGNFHGECITQASDEICLANAKMALTIERQITYLLNPFRNKNSFPSYLIPNEENIGFESGYMITQYTANALTQKIAYLGTPTSIFNITSGNESEDIVSYGASAAEKLLDQLKRFKELIAIYSVVAMQAYGIKRKQMLNDGVEIPKSLLSEQIFHAISEETGILYPTTKDESFDQRYYQALEMIDKGKLPEIICYPTREWSQ